MRVNYQVLSWKQFWVSKESRRLPRIARCSSPHFRRHPCAHALAKADSQSTPSYKRQLFLVRHPSKSAQSLLGPYSWGLHSGEDHISSLWFLSLQALTPDLSQRWHSRARISRRSGAAIPSFVAPASAERCSNCATNRYNGLPSHVGMHGGGSDWPPCCMLISAYVCTTEVGLQRHRVACSAFARSETCRGR